MLVEKLVALGARADVFAAAGSSPLHEAATSGDEDLLKIFEKAAGVDWNLQNPVTGQTPLVAAIASGHGGDVAGFLLAQGADPEIPDNKGRNACDYARILGDDSLAEVLRTLAARTKALAAAKNQKGPRL
jgi:ankyrin repeat protein